MSADRPAAVLSLVDRETINNALIDHQEAIVALLVEADAIRNGIVPKADAVFAALGRIATAVRMVEQVIEDRAEEARS